MMKNIFKQRGAGFTLIELMIALVLLSLIVVAAVSVFINSQKAKRNTELISEAQQGARILLDMITEDVRSAGYGANEMAGHFPIVYAAPFDIMITANLAPYPDDPENHGSPAAINPVLMPLPGGGLYNGGAGTGFTDGAETIRYAFDSNNDGLVDATNDRGDDLEEQLTRNDSLFSMNRQVFGYNSVTNTNGGTSLAIGLARSNFPARPAGNVPVTPMFQYWIYNQLTNDDELYGDTDGNDSLSTAEIEALYASGGVVPAALLGDITRVIITITTSTRSPTSKNIYENITISTTTAITRNREVGESRTISGRVVNDIDANQVADTGDPGIQDVTVTNNTDGQITKTDAAGNYSFKVEPKEHNIMVTLPQISCGATVGYTVVPPVTVAYMVDVSDDDATQDFPLTAYTPGFVRGYAFNDLNNDGVKDAGEVGLGGCTVYLKSSYNTTITDSTGFYCLAGEPDHDSIFCIPVMADPEFVATIPAGGKTAVFITAGNYIEDQNFGFVAGAVGIFTGKVYKDNGTIGIYDGTEDGIPGVRIVIYRGDDPMFETYIKTVTTDDQGNFAASVLVNPDEHYSITEIDPTGFFSTTPNRISGLLMTVEGDTIPDNNFGDMELTAVTIPAARVLCMTTADFREYEASMATAYNDTDIVLGTKYASGAGNIRGWFNKRYQKDGTEITDVTQLFETNYITGVVNSYAYEKYTPPDADIMAMASDTMNEIIKTAPGFGDYVIGTRNIRNSRTRKDLVLGLVNNASGTYNLAVFPAMDTCTRYLTYWDSIGQAAPRDSVPAIFKLVAGGSANYRVNTVALGNFGADGFPDIIAGYTITDNFGGFQLWLNVQKFSGYVNKNILAESRFFPDSGDYGARRTCPDGGEVKSAYAANFLGTAYADLVVGTKNPTGGNIYVYEGTGTAASSPKWFSLPLSFKALGEVVALKVIDVDNDGKKDIVAAVKTGSYEGMVQVWLQVEESGVITFGKLVGTDRGPSYVALLTEGEPLCLEAAYMNWAITHPHVVVGIRTGTYTGMTLVYDCTGGILPEAGSDPSYGYYTGEVATVRLADFNMDGHKDIAVAERRSDTEGNLILYYPVY